MNGVLLKFDGDFNGLGKSFWKLFAPIRRDLDRMVWYVDMQTPPLFEEGDLLDLGDKQHAIVLNAGRFAHFGAKFGDEFISLWAMEPTRDDPVSLVAAYHAGRHSNSFLHEHARIQLLYTDSTCWELYARKPGLIERVLEGIEAQSWVSAFRGQSERRETMFSAAGLQRMWNSWS